MAAATGEPSAKRARTDEDGATASTCEATCSADVEKILDEALLVQNDVDEVVEEEAREISAIQSKYAQKRLGAYERRRKLLSSVPHFWLEVVCFVPWLHFLDHPATS